MYKPIMLTLPLLLAGTSCVPPEIGVRTAVGTSYVDLASIDDVPNYELILPENARGPLPASLPVIDPQVIAPGAPAKPFSPEGQADADRARSMDCLTTAIYHEARSETADGQRAVAQVVLNRVRHPAFPNSVCGVVYQGSQRRTGCQFSFTCDGSLRRRIEPGAWDRARSIAADALAGSVYAPVGMATHYHTTAVRPWWAPSLARAITVGSHIFYRWRGNWGHPLAFKAQYAGLEPGATASADTLPIVGEDAPVPTTPPVRIAALVDGGRVNIHRSRSGAESGPVGVKVHRNNASGSGDTGDSGAAEPVKIHVGEPASIAAAPAAAVAATE
jgi:hypothetical protein